MAATKLTSEELDKLDDQKLAEELTKAKDELFKLRFQRRANVFSA
jgi:large subunit ribosomal protein L29